MAIIKSSCRICINCGFDFEVKDNRIISYTPDKDHPLSEGYLCPKGIAGIEFQQGSDKRLSCSLHKNENNEFDTIDAQQACHEIGQKLAAIIEEHGPRSVALFFGTGAYANTLGNIMSKAWLDASGSPNLFTTVTIDQSSHLITAARMGVFLGGKPDTSDIDVALVSGTNPLVSHKGFLPIESFNPRKKLNQFKAKGQKLIVVDPRLSETAQKADLHLQLIPGEDATLFAGLLNLLFEYELVNEEFCRQYVKHTERLKEAVSDYSIDYVSQRTGVPAEKLTEAAKLFGSAKKPHAACGTGTAMAPDSNLADFLLICMNALTGGYRREGDIVKNQFPLKGLQPIEDVFPPQRTWESGPKCHTQDIGYINGEFPTALLPDEILTPGEDKVRALIVFGGNPATALPDPEKTLKALESLDLLVTMDHRHTETTQLSDYVLATSVQYERHDLSSWIELWPQTNFLQYFEPVVTKPDTVIHDWEAFWEITKAMGRQLDFKYTVIGDVYNNLPEGLKLDMENKPDPEHLLRWICEQKGLCFDSLKQAVGHLPVKSPPYHVTKPAQQSGAKLDVCPDDIFNDIRRVRDMEFDTDGYRLSVRRVAVAMNSAYKDADFIPIKNRQNFAYMHPDDMEKEGLTDGSKFYMSTDFGRIVGTARSDDTVKQGSISMPHCYGALNQEEDPQGELGGHTGSIIPLDPKLAETINFMPHMTGIPVEIKPL